MNFDCQKENEATGIRQNIINIGQKSNWKTELSDEFLMRQHYVRRTLRKKYDEKYTIQTKTSFQPDVLGTAGLYFTDIGTTMNSQKYLELFQDYLGIHMHIYSSS